MAGLRQVSDTWYHIVIPPIPYPHELAAGDLVRFYFFDIFIAFILH
jgi:hypothetical protein